jgi:hypothetical protein
VGDFNGDGVSDILFRNSATTDTGYYQLSGGSSYTWHDLGSTSSAYSVAGVGDFNGDGISDILWRNPTNGDVGAYELSGGGSYSWHDFGLSDPSYSVVGVGDFNGDGVSDILFRNPTTTDLGYYQIVNSLVSAIASWHDLGPTSAAYNVAAVGDYTGAGTNSDILWRNNSSGDIGYYNVTGNSYTWHDLGLSSTAYHAVAQTPLA